MPAVNFTKDAGDRIIAATRKIERTPTNLVGDRNPGAPQDISFWAWLSSASGMNGLFWSWVRVQPVADLPTADDPVTIEDSPLFELSDPHVAGYQNAREASNNRDVPPESIVLLHFAGYDRAGEPQYVFQFHAPRVQAGGLPIHDHRDNFAGGFSYACYHPGTSLPAQPFHV